MDDDPYRKCLDFCRHDLGRGLLLAELDEEPTDNTSNAEGRRGTTTMPYWLQTMQRRKAHLQRR